MDARKTVSPARKEHDTTDLDCCSPEGGVIRCVHLTPETDQLEGAKHFDRIIPNNDQLEAAKRNDHIVPNIDHQRAVKLFYDLTPNTGRLEAATHYDRLKPNADQLEAGDMQRNTNAGGMSPTPKVKGIQTNVDPKPSQLPPGQYILLSPNAQNLSPAYFKYPDNGSPRGFIQQISPVQIMPTERLGFPYDMLSALSPEALIIVCIACCFIFFFPTGLAAVIFAILALMAHNDGNMQQAKSYSMLAQQLIDLYLKSLRSCYFKCITARLGSLLNCAYCHLITSIPK
ncbi:hypothetical protein Btru_044996 [Bulinus truncatus]|nr:hypothetical protein Btru_044996 [Bulinus truncatus]